MINLLLCTFKSGAEFQDLNGASLGRFMLFNFLLHSIPNLLDRRHNGQNSDNFNVLAPFYSKRVITNLVKIGTILCPKVDKLWFCSLKSTETNKNGFCSASWEAVGWLAQSLTFLPNFPLSKAGYGPGWEEIFSDTSFQQSLVWQLISAARLKILDVGWGDSKTITRPLYPTFYDTDMSGSIFITENKTIVLPILDFPLS